MFGDELTVERVHNCQEEMRDADSPIKRAEMIIPCLADFHTFGNFLEVRKLLDFSI